MQPHLDLDGPSTDVVDWLLSRPGVAVEPLFRTDAQLVVHTENYGSDLRPVLCRHPRMERAMITIVEEGLRDLSFEGILYVMGWGDTSSFRPLYVGKAGARGRKNQVSANMAAIGSNRRMFARWGDNYAYHIGDLSHALFRFQEDRPVSAKYARWADTLFASSSSPQLRAPVSLAVVPWHRGDLGPSGRPLDLSALEGLVIAMTSVQYGSLLNSQSGRRQDSAATSANPRRLSGRARNGAARSVR